MTGFSKKTRDVVYERAGECCEVCGRHARGGSLHHRRPRGMGGTKDPASNAASNAVLLCGSGTTGCHGDVERYRLTSLADGLLLSQRQDPATTPVQLRYGLVLLHDDGTYSPTERISL